jgi:hypothetical protein
VAPTHRPECGFHGGARGNAVVHHDHGGTLQWLQRAARHVDRTAAFDLAQRGWQLLLDPVLVDAGNVGGVFVQHHIGR